MKLNQIVKNLQTNTSDVSILANLTCNNQIPCIQAVQLSPTSSIWTIKCVRVSHTSITSCVNRNPTALHCLVYIRAANCIRALGYMRINPLCNEYAILSPAQDHIIIRVFNLSQYIPAPPPSTTPDCLSTPLPSRSESPITYPFINRSNYLDIDTSAISVPNAPTVLAHVNTRCVYHIRSYFGSVFGQDTLASPDSYVKSTDFIGCRLSFLSLASIVLNTSSAYLWLAVEKTLLKRWLETIDTTHYSQIFASWDVKETQDSKFYIPFDQWLSISSIPDYTLTFHSPGYIYASNETVFSYIYGRGCKVLDFIAGTKPIASIPMGLVRLPVIKHYHDVLQKLQEIQAKSAALEISNKRIRLSALQDHDIPDVEDLFIPNTRTPVPPCMSNIFSRLIGDEVKVDFKERGLVVMYCNDLGVSGDQVVEYVSNSGRSDRRIRELKTDFTRLTRARDSGKDYKLSCRYVMKEHHCPYIQPDEAGILPESNRLNSMRTCQQKQNAAHNAYTPSDMTRCRA